MMNPGIKRLAKSIRFPFYEIWTGYTRIIYHLPVLKAEAKKSWCSREVAIIRFHVQDKSILVKGRNSKQTERRMDQLREKQGSSKITWSPRI